MSVHAEASIESMASAPQSPAAAASASDDDAYTPFATPAPTPKDAKKRRDSGGDTGEYTPFATPAPTPKDPTMGSKGEGEEDEAYTPFATPAATPSGAGDGASDDAKGAERARESERETESEAKGDETASAAVADGDADEPKDKKKSKKKKTASKSAPSSAASSPRDEDSSAASKRSSVASHHQVIAAAVAKRHSQSGQPGVKFGTKGKKTLTDTMAELEFEHFKFGASQNTKLAQSKFSNSSTGRLPSLSQPLTAAQRLLADQLEQQELEEEKKRRKEAHEAWRAWAREKRAEQKKIQADLRKAFQKRTEDEDHAAASSQSEVAFAKWKLKKDKERAVERERMRKEEERLMSQIADSTTGARVPGVSPPVKGGQKAARSTNLKWSNNEKPHPSKLPNMKRRQLAKVAASPLNACISASLGVTRKTGPSKGKPLTEYTKYDPFNLKTRPGAGPLRRPYHEVAPAVPVSGANELTRKYDPSVKRAEAEAEHAAPRSPSPRTLPPLSDSKSQAELDTASAEANVETPETDTLVVSDSPAKGKEAEETEAQEAEAEAELKKKREKEAEMEMKAKAEAEGKEGRKDGENEAGEDGEEDGAEEEEDDESSPEKGETVAAAAAPEASPERKKETVDGVDEGDATIDAAADAVESKDPEAAAGDASSPSPSTSPKRKRSPSKSPKKKKVLSPIEKPPMENEQPWDGNTNIDRTSERVELKLEAPPPPRTLFDPNVYLESTSNVPGVGDVEVPPPKPEVKEALDAITKEHERKASKAKRDEAARQEVLASMTTSPRPRTPVNKGPGSIPKLPIKRSPSPKRSSPLKSPEPTPVSPQTDAVVAAASAALVPSSPDTSSSPPTATSAPTSSSSSSSSSSASPSVVATPSTTSAVPPTSDRDLSAMDAPNQEVLGLTFLQLQQFAGSEAPSRTSEPGRTLLAVIGMICLILGEKTRWKHAKLVLRAEDFQQRLVAVDPATVGEKVRSVAVQLSRTEDGFTSLTVAAKAGAVASTLTMWVIAALTEVAKLSTT